MVPAFIEKTGERDRKILIRESSKYKNALRLNTTKKGCKLPQEHIIERHNLDLGEHWSGKASLRIWF